MAENTGGPSKSPGAAGSKATGDEIQAQTFRDMLNILKDMRSHTHQYFDDYTTVCQCQCNCQRGTL
jgi:hypothetical protein